jgi:casein kinase II subunit beta
MAGSSESSSMDWVEWFLSQSGHEMFCEVDKDYILDRFNLVELNQVIPHFKKAFELVTNQLDFIDEKEQSNVDFAAW